jgi:hypothetical protein
MTLLSSPQCPDHQGNAHSHQRVSGVISLALKQQGLHLHPVPRLGMHGATPPFPLYVFIAWCLTKFRDIFAVLPLFSLIIFKWQWWPPSSEVWVLVLVDACANVVLVRMCGRTKHFGIKSVFHRKLDRFISAVINVLLADKDCIQSNSAQAIRRREQNDVLPAPSAYYVSS